MLTYGEPILDRRIQLLSATPQGHARSLNIGKCATVEHTGVPRGAVDMGKDTLERAPATKAPRARGDTEGDTSLPPSESAAQVRQQVEVYDANAVTCYANFCRVTGTPEELILDFGLNANPMPAQEKLPPIEIKQRLIVNFLTAKRMLQALHVAVARHEQAFGVLETDVAKRVVGRSGARAE
jgi:hypothetical protein